MASSQQMLSSLLDMQPNAQAALPVIPNNGNPGGAYNMPQQQVAQPEPAKPAGPDLSWLQPSQHMQVVNQTLQSLQQNVEASRRRLGEVQQQTQQLQQPSAQPASVLPVIPSMNQITPTATSTNVVMPRFG